MSELQELLKIFIVRVQDEIKNFFPLVTYDGDWFATDKDYNYDWYCPIGAPPSQQMWSEYLNWANHHLEVILHQGYYRQVYGSTIPYPVWIPWRADDDREEYDRVMKEIASYKEEEI